MITPRIEKAILSGWCTYQKVNHAFSTFGSVTIPKGHTVIILDVKWNHFFNTWKNDRQDETTLKDLMKYSEYTLKIDGKKSKNYLIFKNRIDFKVLKPDLTISINTSFKDIADGMQYIFPQHPQPIQQDVFFVCENYIKLTITRNEYINDINTDYTTLNPVANEAPTPSGVKNIDVLKNFLGKSIAGQKFIYRPPNNQNANPNTLGTEPQTMQSYTQPIDQNSGMSKPDANSNTIYFNYPLVELGYIIFNNNDFDKIMNQ